MGLDATIKRPDGHPLGNISVVQSALAAAFPGVKFGMLPSGLDKIRAAAERGIEFPPFLKEQFEAVPAKHGGDYQGADFTAAFDLGSSDHVDHIAVLLHGTTTASDPMFMILEREYDG